MDDTFSYLSNSYGKNHYDIDMPFKEIINFFSGKNINLSALGAYSGKELYETTDYIDKISKPELSMWGINGERIDDILLNPLEKQALKKLIIDFGINRPYVHEKSLIKHYAMGYLVADPGIYCIITLTNQTAYAISKYAPDFNYYVPELIGDKNNLYLGATWFTEVQGGSDIGNNLTVANKYNDKWLLTGDKYFASNAGLADVSLTSAFHDNNSGAKGLSLFLMPRKNQNNQLNYKLRRLKDKSATKSVPSGEVELNNSEAYMIGDAGRGIYYITEDLMVSRLDNAAAACGIARKAYLEAYYYSIKRKAFGKYLIEHYGIKKDLTDMEVLLEGSIALTFKSIYEFDKVLDIKPPYNDDYNYARLLTHIVKNITAESSSYITQMAMEMHGGIGFLKEFPVERWHREALITPIWEGASNIQALDMLEAIFKKNAHKKLLDDFNNMVNNINNGKEYAEKSFMLIKGEINKLFEYNNNEAQFYAKEIMKNIGNAMSSILLIYIGNKNNIDRFIDSGILYYSRYVKKLDYDLSMVKKADSIINIESIENTIKDC